MRLPIIILICILLHVTQALGPRRHTRHVKHQHWAQIAAQFLREIKCDVNHQQCERLHDVQLAQMSLWIADGNGRRKLSAILPDGQLIGSYDAYLAIDPFPNVSYGHLVLLFAIDHRPDAAHACEAEPGSIYIKSHQDCMKLLRKNRCQHGQRSHRRCDIDFLPAVYDVDEHAAAGTRSRQLLHCVNDPNFAQCSPQIRPRRNTNLDTVEHQRPAQIRCRLLETCDHAVILHGGWNDRMHKSYDAESSLRKLSYATRDRWIPAKQYQNLLCKWPWERPNLSQALHPPYRAFRRLARRPSIRNHIRQVCAQANCVDSFVLMLHGPTLHNGHLLLWDRNENGLAESSEYYTAEEIASDLSNCGANQVFVLADIFICGSAYQCNQTEPTAPSVYDDIRKRVASLSTRGTASSTWQWINQTRLHHGACMENVFEASKRLTVNSTPHMYDASLGYIHATMFGAPCNVIPEFTEEEFRRSYYGCQHVPSAVWFGRRSTGSEELPISMAESQVNLVNSDAKSKLPIRSDSELNNSLAERRT